MIKNERQYSYTKRRLSELEKDYLAIKKKYSNDKNKLALLGQGYIEHIQQLKGEIREYEKMKNNPLPVVLLARTLKDINKALTRIRIHSKMTQAKLAARIGCKQADISRLEKESYEGYSIGLLKRIANGLNADLELKFIPKRRNVNHRKEKVS